MMKKREISLCPRLVMQNCSWGAAGVRLDQSMCSSILKLPPLLLQEEGKHLSAHSATEL